MRGLCSLVGSLPAKDSLATVWSLMVPDRKGEQVSTRIPSIESFRVLAIFAVILWHSHFLSSLSQLADGNFFVVLNGYLVWWVGVPYFFITAGYFFQRSVLTQGHPMTQFHRYASPLLWLLLVWLCIYTVTPSDWPAEVRHHGLWQPFHAEALRNIQLLESRHLWIFIEGVRPVWHLWFLPALIFSLAILTLLAIGKLQRHLPLLAAGIYVLILAEESTPRNLLNAPIPLGPWIIAIPLVAMGGWFAERRESVSTTMAWSLILGGYAVALMEGTVMNMVFHSSMQAIKGHQFLGGILFSLGIFYLALAKPQLGRSTPFPFLGQLTLGIYVAHVLVMYTITPFVWKLSDKVPLWGLLLGLMVYGATAVFVVALTRVPILKFLVVRPAWRFDQISRPDPRPIDNAHQNDPGRQLPPHAA
ncbi:MAG: acyltransferase [Nitrospira sp.]|nr:acyltransferase [Nitrospira sp.]